MIELQTSAVRRKSTEGPAAHHKTRSEGRAMCRMDENGNGESEQPCAERKPIRCACEAAENERTKAREIERKRLDNLKRPRYNNSDMAV